MRKNLENEKDERKDHDELIRLEKSYATIYVTLISIIQATVFGYLIAIFYEHYNDLKPLDILIFATTFLIIVIIWNQYILASTAFRYIPRLFPDSILPFLLGFIETLVINQIFSQLYLWCYSVALMMFIGWLAVFNGYQNAHQHPANKVLFQRLGSLPRISQVITLLLVIIFLILGLISQRYTSNQLVQYIVACFFLLTMIIQMAMGAKYWELILRNLYGRK
jgi:hypothetical protein